MESRLPSAPPLKIGKQHEQEEFFCEEDMAMPVFDEEERADAAAPALTCVNCNDSFVIWGGPVYLTCGHCICCDCLQQTQSVCPVCNEMEEWVPVSVPPIEVEEYEKGLYENGRGGLFSGVKVSPDKKLGALLKTMKQFAVDKSKQEQAPGKVRRKHSLYAANNFNEEVEVMRAVFEADPPEWMPDSSATSCTQCSASFKALTRGRHHCRFCGGIFCHSCSSTRSLLPPKFRIREPQRVCDGCANMLEPGQTVLAFQVSRAFQSATHDVTDYTCFRSWLNSPLGLSMEHEIYKATNSLRQFHKAGRLKPEQSIPEAVLKCARGLAIVTVVKVGMAITYKLGTGLVVARFEDDRWSAPSAITSCGMGWGLQAGGELTDFIIILRNEAAVKAFSGRVHLSVGAGLSLAAGPVGRVAEADVRTGDGGIAACYTYSCSKGAFLGCSLEGNVVTTRTSVNSLFYGDACVTTKNILFGAVPQPTAAKPLYDALAELYSQ